MNAKTRTISLFLLKKGIKYPVRALTSKDWTKRIPINEAQSSLNGELFIRNSEPKTPHWATFFQDAGIDVSEHIRPNQHSSALLFVNVASRIMVVALGYGRHWLKNKSLVPDFGRRFAMNAVHPEKFLCAGTRTVGTLVRTSKHQLSRTSNIREFGIDFDCEMLGSVTGVPEDVNLASRISGSDALGLTAKLELSDVRRICISALSLHKAKEYRTRFPWVDNFREVKDKKKLQHLIHYWLMRLEPEKPIGYGFHLRKP